MPKFVVEVDITWEPTRKELGVYASNEIEAEEKAEGIVMKWNNVRDVEIVSVEEE